MVLCEQSVQSRNMIVRGEGINQKMNAYMVSQHALADMMREHEFTGFACEANVKLYGDRCIGSVDACDNDIRHDRRSDSVEPIFYSLLPQPLYTSTMQAMCAATVIALPAGQGMRPKQQLHCDFRTLDCTLLRSTSWGCRRISRLGRWVPWPAKAPNCTIQAYAKFQADEAY